MIARAISPMADSAAHSELCETCICEAVAAGPEADDSLNEAASALAAAAGKPTMWLADDGMPVARMVDRSIAQLVSRSPSNTNAVRSTLSKVKRADCEIVFRVLAVAIDEVAHSASAILRSAHDFMPLMPFILVSYRIKVR